MVNKSRKTRKTFDFYIRKAWLKIYNMYNHEAESKGYSISMAYVLLNIDRNEGTPATQIGPLMGLQKASLSRTLKIMEDEGLILRKIDEEDNRIRRVFLTDLGERYRQISKEVVLRFQSDIEKSFPEETLEVFIDVLEKITELADKQRRNFDREKSLLALQNKNSKNHKKL